MRVHAIPKKWLQTKFITLQKMLLCCGFGTFEGNSGKLIFFKNRQHDLPLNNHHLSKLEFIHV